MIRRVVLIPVVVAAVLGVSVAIARASQQQLGGAAAVRFEDFSKPPVAPWTGPQIRTLFLQAAFDYWHQAPACGTPRFVYVSSPPPGPTVQPSAAAFVLSAASCQINIVRSRVTYEIFWEEPGAICRLIAHEYAHLLGLWDVPQPGTMLSFHISPTLPDPPCDRAVHKMLVTGDPAGEA